MLRRPLQSRPPCILRVGRLTSTYSRNPNSRQNAVRALANSLVVHGLTGGTKSSTNNGLEPKTVQVIDVQTKEEITIDLQKVQPFTPEFALLPLQYRTLVERRNLLETLRQRQKTTYDVEVEGAAEEELAPGNELVKKYVSEFIKRRRHTSDKPPSDAKISRYIEAAKQKALKAQRHRISSRAVEETPDDSLSFEEQWRRRQIYGDNILKPMTPGYIARYNPNRDLKSPVKPRNITIEQLLAAGSHIGHNKSSCHPAMKPFISGLHDTTHIINLDYTLAHLRRACTIVREVAFRHGVVLIIGTRKGHKPILTNATERMGAYMLSRKWIPGTLTNGKAVLFRGYVKEEPTPFRQYAKGVTKEDLSALPPELENRRLIKKQFTWDAGTENWQSETEQGKVQNSSVTTASVSQQKPSIAKKDKNLAEWMAWDKFASIIQDVSDLSSDIINLPRQSAHATLAINSEYIPDHSDNWYTRQLTSEIDELTSRKSRSNKTGDRNPIEMHEMDKFLARKKYRGLVRGRYFTESISKLESGFAKYPRVKVFRDGSTMVGQHRFDKDGSPLIQYPDGSYMVDQKLYDPEGKRYDMGRDSLIFSDGSEIKFVGKGKDRKLMIVIGRNSFDVTSTVVGSAQKQEILQRASELINKSNESKESDNVEGKSLEGKATLEQLFGAPEEAVNFQFYNERKIEDNNAQVKGKEEDMEDSTEEVEDMKGSEMLEIWDETEAKHLDEVTESSSSMTVEQEELAEAEDVPKLPETPFDNLYSRGTSTVRPDLIIVLNPRENRLALREAANHQVPTIGIIDTDTDPRTVTYSIPANDDSLRSVEYIMGVLSRAGEEGQIHRNRYTMQLESLLQRAKELLFQSWEDHEKLSEDDVDIRDPRLRVVSEKYLKWYNLDPRSTQLSTLQKIAAQHVVLAQDEIKRLRTDTTGWSMQDFLDHLKTSTQFPGIPDAVLEEMAQIQLKKSREAWAESREKVKLRDINYAPERFNGRVDIQT